MKRRTAHVIAYTLLFAALGLAFAAALEYSGSHIFKNEFNTSGVNLKLEQFQVIDDEMIPAEKGLSVMPGAKASYVPRVTNLEENSYIRVKLELFAGDECVAVTPDAFYGIGDGWFSAGNYLYCRKVFEQGESADVIEGIVIPSEIGTGEGKVQIRTTADAIQARNFKPDFSKQNPWGSVKIQNISARVGSASICRETASLQSLDFSFAKEGTFECSTEDLFSGFDSFQPGDTCSEKLDMKNNSGKRLVIHFKTVNQKTDLLEKMELTISCCGENVYNGSLASQTLASFMEVGTLEEGDSGKLEFEISMPREAGNSYSMLRDNVTWVIAVSEAEDGSSQKKPATGDRWLPLALAALGISGALLAAVTAVFAGRRKDRRSDQRH